MLQDLFQLRRVPDLDRSAVEFQVISEGERGLLGVGFIEARVIARVMAPQARQAPAPRPAAARPSHADGSPPAVLTEALERICEGIGVSARVAVAEEEGALRATLSGPDVGLLIGKHGQTIDAIQHLVEKGEDRDLNRVNVLDFSRKTGLDEEKVISGFLHASRLGIFDLGWNVLCPGCSGVLDAHATLKSLRHDDYNCALCAAGYEASVDDLVEVAFTVSPRIRRIGAHDPNTLPL